MNLGEGVRQVKAYRGAFVLVVIAMAIAAVAAVLTPAGSARAAVTGSCVSPAARPSGGYSSYVTYGRMPLGTTRVMDDGDRWSCTRGGQVIVWSDGFGHTWSFANDGGGDS
jgi:hypothetical protein